MLLRIFLTIQTVISPKKVISLINHVRKPIITDIMAEEKEKRGPIEKGEKGWPINPLGVFALVVFLLIVVLLIARPLFVQKTTSVAPEQGNAPGGRILAPSAGG